eukprot:scaffold689_cov375-Prasinococcus_capsulatus_cf.AAC.4
MMGCGDAAPPHELMNRHPSVTHDRRFAAVEPPKEWMRTYNYHPGVPEVYTAWEAYACQAALSRLRSTHHCWADSYLHLEGREPACTRTIGSSVKHASTIHSPRHS